MFEVSFAFLSVTYTFLLRVKATLLSSFAPSTCVLGSWRILIWALTREVIELIGMKALWYTEVIKSFKP